MFRSGPLTEARMRQIVRWVEKMPHNLRAVAKVCRVYPADLLAWYAAGQDLECRDRWMVELAWEIDRVRAEKAAANYARIEAAADGGEKRKRVTRADGSEETTVEDVLPAAWAIERLEELHAASPWEISPNADQADELHKMMRELEPTPLLPAGEPSLSALRTSDETPPGPGPLGSPEKDTPIAADEGLPHPREQGLEALGGA